MEALKTTTPVARKKHVCNWCGGKIVEGEKYNKQATLFDGRIYDWVSHLDCLVLADLLNMFDYDDGDGIDEKIFEGRVRDYINENHYNDDTAQFDEGWDGLSVHDAVIKIKEELLKSL